MTLTPIRVHIAPMGGGTRRIVLACSCVKVGRYLTAWESDDEAIAQLLIDHRRQAPACRHPHPPSASPRTGGPSAQRSTKEGPAVASRRGRAQKLKGV